MERFLPDLVQDEDYPIPFGRYTLTGLLGEGGMARVFRADLAGPRGFTKPVAVKIVRAAVVSQDEDLKRALVHEARIGGMLHHPNIVETYELGELRGFPYIAMELVEGVGLELLVQKVRPLPPAVVLDLARQICAGLHHAHEFAAAGLDDDLVHRDLKPSNVLLSRNGVVKIADFGIAKAGDMTGNTTATGIAKGTPAYMSPQQANAERVDRRSDIFALGAILYELSTGRRLFRGDTLVSTLMAVLRVEERIAKPGFDEVLEGVLPGMADVVRTCLRHDPAQRYPSCEHLDAALAGLQAHASGAPPLRRWLHSVTPELEKSLDGMDEPRARAAIQHLTAGTDPTVGHRTEPDEEPAHETRPSTEPVQIPRRRRLAGAVAFGGLAVLALGLMLLWNRPTDPLDVPALADLSMPDGVGTATGEAGADAAILADPDGLEPGDGRAPGNGGPASDAGAPPALSGAARATATPPPRAATPTPTPRRATPTPTPSPAEAKPADERPDEVAAWEATPEPSPTPRTKTEGSSVPPPSRESLERAGRDRAPNRDLLREAAFRVTDPKTRSVKEGRKWTIDISARIAGSTRVKATLHVRTGSGKWRTHKLERTGSDRWSVSFTLPNSVDRDVQYWIDAENLATDDDRVDRQVVTLGSATRPQFHYLD